MPLDIRNVAPWFKTIRDAVADEDLKKLSKADVDTASTKETGELGEFSKFLQEKYEVYSQLSQGTNDNKIDSFEYSKALGAYYYEKDRTQYDIRTVEKELKDAGLSSSKLPDLTPIATDSPGVSKETGVDYSPANALDSFYYGISGGEGKDIDAPALVSYLKTPGLSDENRIFAELLDSRDASGTLVFDTDKNGKIAGGEYIEVYAQHFGLSKEQKTALYNAKGLNEATDPAVTEFKNIKTYLESDY